tara:strand:- start:171 stop:524 length:354 start_codon:yes stop_codon:yes gene_type:complete
MSNVISLIENNKSNNEYLIPKDQEAIKSGPIIVKSSTVDFENIKKEIFNLEKIITKSIFYDEIWYSICMIPLNGKWILGCKVDYKEYANKFVSEDIKDHFISLHINKEPNREYYKSK